MCDAASLPSDNSNGDLPVEVSPGGLSLSQLGEMLAAERNYLLAIATQELGLHLKSKGGESDLVQDTFLNATRDLRHFSGRTPDEFRSWLRSIQQLHFEDIARQLNCSAEASRKLWCRAVEALQTEMLSQNHDISGPQ